MERPNTARARPRKRRSRAGGACAFVPGRPVLFGDVSAPTVPLEPTGAGVLQSPAEGGKVAIASCRSPGWRLAQAANSCARVSTRPTARTANPEAGELDANSPTTR